MFGPLTKEVHQTGGRTAKVVPSTLVHFQGTGERVNHAAMIVNGLIIGAVLVVLVALTIRKSRRPPRLSVNGVLQVEADRGTDLLSVLAARGIQLPGTCGGKGACAQCKCQVLTGGGPISQQEVPYFSPEAIRDHWRLACQVTVMRDMAVRVPDALLTQALGAAPEA